jgi:hypothetical protein
MGVHYDMSRDIIETPALTPPFGQCTRDAPFPAMLDLRGHNGIAFALPYTHLEVATYHPLDGITLEFRDYLVNVRGRNLRPAYDCLVQHRATYLQEEDFDIQPETETCIDAIRVEKRVKRKE